MPNRSLFKLAQWSFALWYFGRTSSDIRLCPVIYCISSNRLSLAQFFYNSAHVFTPWQLIMNACIVLCKIVIAIENMTLYVFMANIMTGPSWCHLFQPYLACLTKKYKLCQNLHCINWKLTHDTYYTKCLFHNLFWTFQVF